MTTITATINLDPGYDFAASIRFLEGFTPAAYTSYDTTSLILGFPSDDHFLPAAEHVAESEDALNISITGNADPEKVKLQIIRILSLNHDAAGYGALLAADPALRLLADSIGALRPVLFSSPFEAACWCIIGNRIRISQAAKVKQGMATQLGTELEIAKTRTNAFPSPHKLLEMRAFPGLTDRKIEYLHHVANAALAGNLDAETLAKLPTTQALAQLQQIKGIGPFSAELILIRGVGTSDLAPIQEGRFRRAVALAYGIPDIDDATLQSITTSWAPYRSWVSVLMRANLEAVTHEIGGTRML